MTKPAHFVAIAPCALTGGSRWYAEIEICGRAHAATGETLRECAERLYATINERTRYAASAI